MSQDQKPQVPMMPRNWSVDKLFLDDIIKSEIQKSVYLMMDPIISEERAIRKPELDNIIVSTVNNVVPFISESYKTILEYYVDKEKLSEYIIGQIFFALLVLMREKNKVVLKDVTAFKTTDVLSQLNT